MKKLATFVAAVAMAVPVPMAFSTPAQAAAGGNSETVGFCKDYVAAGYDANLTVGNCVALLTTENHYYNDGTSAGGFAAQACGYIENNYPDIFAVYYSSHAECVQDGASAFI